MAAMSRAAAAALVAFAALARGETVVAPITSLPGLASMPPFAMSSGYISFTSPVLKSTHNIFHWVVESSEDPLTDPIVFWTNGGPGCSGLYGMGFEHGPFLVQADGGVRLNPLSWNRGHTMVYIEQPAGVGFSYSSVPGETFNDEVSSADNAAFLSAFFAAYPKYQGLPLFLTSESYGGNYIPQAARRVLEGGDARLATQLRRGGFAVGNPVFSIDENATFAGIMNVVTADILFGHALLPLSFTQRYRAAGCDAAAPPAACDALTAEMFTLAGTCFGGNNFETNACGDNMYNNPYGNASLGAAVVPYPDQDNEWNKWLNRADVQAAIHARKPLAPHADCSDIKYDVTWPSSLPDYSAAFAAGLKVLIFSGDVDVTTCPFASTQVAVDALTKAFPAAGAVTSPWRAWQAAGVAGNQTVGYIERHRDFAFATIKAGGHEAPAYQPLASYQLLRAFTRGALAELPAPPQPSPPAGGAAQRRLTQGSVLREAVRKSQRRA